MDDTFDGDENTCTDGRRPAVKNSINSAIDSKDYLLLEGHDHLALIIMPCTYVDASQLARMIRSRLKLDHPSGRPNFAIAQVDSGEIDKQSLIADLSISLDENIEMRSSRIQVKRHKS